MVFVCVCVVSIIILGETRHVLWSFCLPAGSLQGTVTDASAGCLGQYRLLRLVRVLQAGNDYHFVHVLLMIDRRFLVQALAI